MNIEQKRFLVNGIDNGTKETIDFLNNQFSSLFSDVNIKKVIKAFSLSDMEAIKLLAFQTETINQLCVNLASLDTDIYRKDGAIFWLTDKLLEIEPKPYWVIWYKISEFKRWQTNYKSRTFKAKKEVIRSLFALAKSNTSPTHTPTILNRWDEEVQELCRRAFKNRSNPKKWVDGDEEFRQAWHEKFRSYSNYNEKDQNEERNKVAWETYGMCVYRADLGLWMTFDDIQDETLKSEIVMRTRVYCDDSINVLKKNLSNKTMIELYDNAIKILESNVQKLNNLLVLRQAQ